jgi:hypothetical protein
MDIKGKRVLLVDDIADTGTSLLAAKKHMEEKGASAVRIACIHRKPGSALEPDYYVMTSGAWIVYPWEMHEMEHELKR